MGCVYLRAALQGSFVRCHRVGHLTIFRRNRRAVAGDHTFLSPHAHTHTRRGRRLFRGRCRSTAGSQQ